MTAVTPADADLAKKCRKTAEKFSENLYVIANEPTLACYRIQEHVHKSGPMLIDRGNEMRKVRKNLQKCCYGMDYSIKTIRAMGDSVTHFQNIQQLIKNAIFIKQQLDYESNVKARVKAKQKQAQESAIATNVKKTAFQRFSGSFDLPATLITSSLSGISNSASTDLKELRSVLSSQFRSQPSSSGSTDSAAASDAAAAQADQPENRPSTSSDHSP